MEARKSKTIEGNNRDFKWQLGMPWGVPHFS